MNIYETAMQIEKEGERVYRQLSEKTTDKGLKSIYDLLAENEVKHYDAFRMMNEGAPVELVPTNIVGDVKAIFEKMRQAAAAYSEATPLEDVYKKAMEGEAKSVAFYQDLLNRTEDSDYREAIEVIIEEEKRHVGLLHNMIEFLEQPKLWLENAEFNHMQSY